MPGTVLNSGETAVNKMKPLHSWGSHSITEWDGSEGAENKADMQNVYSVSDDDSKRGKLEKGQGVLGTVAILNIAISSLS